MESSQRKISFQVVLNGVKIEKNNSFQDFIPTLLAF